MTRKIAIASDHAAVELKAALIEEIKASGFEPVNMGTDSADSVDYPDFAEKVASAILKGEVEMGVLICGSGIGMSMAANRHKGIRAALCHTGLEASLTRQHNNANILCLGARIIGVETAKDCLKTFLATAFEGGRHQKRIDKLG